MARTKQSFGVLNMGRPTREIKDIPDLSDAVHDKPLVYDCSCGETLKSGLCPLSYRCREPLAWWIKPETILAQDNCPLFTIIPKELRLLIWEFALTDTTFKYEDNGGMFRSMKNDEEQCEDIAFNLMHTCRAVYLETFTLALNLNPFEMRFTSRHYFIGCYLPWQFACIQSLDLRLIQAQLEDNSLKALFLTDKVWDPEGRHTGVYVVPQYCVTKGRDRVTSTYAPNPPFSNISATTTMDRQKRLQDAIQQASNFPAEQQFSKSSTLRVMLARPIKHLTLRLTATDWWTWTDDPDTSDDEQQLGLDPALGTGSDDPDERPTFSRMRSYSEQRRAGRYSDSHGSDVHSNPLLDKTPKTGWGAIIGSLPDLRTLELVLETFVDKKRQLENVVECAKTWKFPIVGSSQMLVWDGLVETKRWSKKPAVQPKRVDLPWCTKCTDFEVRIVRFRRQRI